MALKLGKCRLCLKLGDFYSIFTIDNAIQLSEMAMECAKIKIYDGDGLPDKICSECIEKLSGAYIFKQQCERADEQLRRNYVPPPGFNITPSPTRQSSDSGISHRTDVSNKVKKSIEPESSTSSVRKRSLESVDTSNNGGKYRYKPSTSKPRDKRARPTYDSDEDYTASQASVDTDSDDPVMHKCDLCDKTFPSRRSMLLHGRVHSRENNIPKSHFVEIPLDNSDIVAVDEDKVACDGCGKTFKLKIMLNRHYLTCPNKTQDNDASETSEFTCKLCNEKYKTIDGLTKHIKVAHNSSAPNPEPKNVPVPCLYCHKPFTDYFVHASHFNSCNMRSAINTYNCLLCKRKFGRKGAYFSHIRDAHFNNSIANNEDGEEPKESYDCRLCGRSVSSQDELIKHLAAHMSNIDETGATSEADDRNSMVDDIQSNYSGASSQASRSVKCKYCDKVFTYKKALLNHMLKHTADNIPLKEEPVDLEPDPPPSSHTAQDDQHYDDFGEEEELSDDDNTCDICDKQFSYKRLLIQHKKAKHNKSSGFKRADVYLKDCDVKCLICDIDMKVSQGNEHNKKHAAAGTKPRNLYTCKACGETFKSCSNLSTHIQITHRIKKKSIESVNMADFCEVVVTKTEPLDDIQSHNDLGEVPGKSVDSKNILADLEGFTCSICGKKMPTLTSLKRHVNWHSGVGSKLESKLECFVCKLTFRFKGQYKLHMQEHYRDPNIDPKFLTCHICNRKSKHLRAAQMHMNFHKQTRFGSKDYRCAICEKVFQHRKVYLTHMAIHYKRQDGFQNVSIGEGTNNSEGKHQCPHCEKKCDSLASLKCHINWHNSKASLYGARYNCDFCDKIFTNKKGRDIHLRIHYEHENGPYKCHICGKGFIDENYYRRHVKGHNFDHQSHKIRIAKLRANKVKCPICPRYYPNLIKLIRHIRRTHPETKMIKEDPDAPALTLFHCKVCAKAFRTERRLATHESSHLRRHQFFKCKFCGRKSLSLRFHNVHIKAHLTKKYVDEPLQCPHCPETFVLGYALHKHLKSAHDIEESWIAEGTQADEDGELQELQCGVCMKVLASKGNFGRHIDFHNMLRCNYCFEYFSSLKFLEGHLAFSCEKKKLLGDTEVHPKRVKCHLCYKAFHVQVKLDCHLRTRHGILVKRERREKEREIVCDYCFRVFENEDALNAHRVYHRTVGYYGCIYCSRKFNTMALYKKHKAHHLYQLNVDNPTKCEHCDETFVPFREFIDHMREVHGDDKDWVVMPKESVDGVCNICNKEFNNLQRHLQLHEENKCKKCGEYFLSRPAYDNHLCDIESDDAAETEASAQDAPCKYEECSFCFKALTKGNSKLQHDLIHRGSGSISCRFCALRFKTMDAFNIHAFSHRSRKYTKNPLKCRKCDEQFVKYGPFIKHMRAVHNLHEKMHYRRTVLPEPCAICGASFPNLHNHYRAHLLNRCLECGLYFTSARVFHAHKCGETDATDEHVFQSDVDVAKLIQEYAPKDTTDDQNYYGHNEDEPIVQTNSIALSLTSQIPAEPLVPISIQSPLISDVLLAYEEQQKMNKKEAAVDDDDDDVVEILDDDPVVASHPIIIIDD